MPMLLSINDTCKMLSIGRTKTYELIRAEEIEVVKIGNRTLVVRESIEKLVERKRS